eukprot:c48503_g1_i1 orf=282-578(+)
MGLDLVVVLRHHLMRLFSSCGRFLEANQLFGNVANQVYIHGMRLFPQMPILDKEPRGGTQGIQHIVYSKFGVMLLAIASRHERVLLCDMCKLAPAEVT